MKELVFVPCYSVYIHATRDEVVNSCLEHSFTFLGGAAGQSRTKLLLAMGELLNILDFLFVLIVPQETRGCNLGAG